MTARVGSIVGWLVVLAACGHAPKPPVPPPAQDHIAILASEITATSARLVAIDEHGDRQPPQIEVATLARRCEHDRAPVVRPARVRVVPGTCREPRRDLLDAHTCDPQALGPGLIARRLEHDPPAIG